MLSSSNILSQLPAYFLEKYNRKILIFDTLTSTNDYLLDLAKRESPDLQVCVSHTQTAGRGRYQKRWQSPPGGNLYYSHLFKINSIDLFSGISLAVGINLCKFIREIYHLDCWIKWPNDIYVDRSDPKKIAGILSEFTMNSFKQHFLIIGIGVNVVVPEPILSQLGATDFASQQVKLIDRSIFIAQMIALVDTAVNDLVKGKWLGYYESWSDYDILYGKKIHLKTATDCFQGICKGITNLGYLQVLINGKLEQFSAAEVSIVKQ